MSTCLVCCDNFNKSTRKQVTCLYCYIDICTTCIKKYLLTSIEDAHCLQCKNSWNREFLINNIGKTFVNNEYKNHRENILFEREKSYLPDAQADAREELRRRDIITRLENIRNEIRDLQSQERRLCRELNRNNNTTRDVQNTRTVVVRKCPVDDCRGFLSTDWICELCSSVICQKCNDVVVDPETHECDPDNVKTVELLAKDSKPCPTCGTFIHKTSGCAQMWCPNCHTAFDWRTLNIETGIVHNPHYYEFQRSNNDFVPRNPLDIPCGGLPPLINLRRCGLRVMDFHRLTHHMEIVELPWYTNVNPLRRLRVAYLLNDINEIEWKRALQKNEKKFTKNSDIRDVIHMFVDTASDLFRQYITDRSVPDESTLIMLLEKLASYFNEAMITIENRYDCVVPHIQPCLTVHRRHRTLKI